jgi:hypothetical protein
MKKMHQNLIDNHRFAVGATVRLNRIGSFGNAVSGAYKILAKLPEQDGELQYRIKSEHEPYQRIVKEYQLERD